MSKTIDCTGGAFRDLVNPYTGEPMAVKMVVRPGAEPLFFAPDTYDVRVPADSSRKAHELWSRVNGIAGLRSGVPRCAYTGEVLTFHSDADGHAWLTGGFHPTMLHPREEFLYKATMRDGRPSRPAPSSLRAEPVFHAPKAKSHAKDISQDALDMAGESVAKARKAARR